jgi:hypothetical protein
VAALLKGIDNGWQDEPAGQDGRLRTWARNPSVATLSASTTQFWFRVSSTPANLASSSGSNGSLFARLSRGIAGHDPPRIIRGLRCPGKVAIFGGPAAAWAVAIDVGDAILAEIERECIGIPGATRVATGRVSRPPRDADRTLLPEDVSDLK